MNDIGKIELVFLLLLVFIIVFGLIARRLGTPYPIVMVIGGLLLGFVPAIPEIVLNPDLVFLWFCHLCSMPLRGPLPGATFGTTWSASFCSPSDWSDSLLPPWRSLRPAFFAGFDWRLGFVLGAVVAPTDAIAATSIARRVGLPRRIVDILEGESLINGRYRLARASIRHSYCGPQASADGVDRHLDLPPGYCRRTLTGRGASSAYVDPAPDDDGDRGPAAQAY